MKKILIATNLILLILLIFQTCRCWKKDPNPNNNTGNHPKTFCEDSACFGYTGVEPHGMIDFETAKKMADDYADDKGKKFVWDNETKSDSADAVNIWFDLKKVKTFIGLIESSLCKAGCAKSDSFGIRIYYAKYPDTTTMKASEYLAGVPLEYAHRHTVFMIPTYWDDIRKENIDFDPLNTGSNCAFAPYNPSSAKKQLVFAPFIAAGSSGVQGQNHGSLMPPPAGSGSLPTN